MTSIGDILSTQECEIRDLRKIIRKLCNPMKLIRYVKPSARLTKKHQIEATDHLEDIGSFAITIVDGEDGRTLENAIKILKPKNGLVVHSVGTFSRSRQSIVDACKKVFAKGANIVEADGKIHTPDDADALFSGIMLGKHLAKGSGRHGGHNKISEAKRSAAFLLWQTNSLTNDEVAELAGISYQAMYKWWGKSHPRNQEPGRRPKRKR